MAISSNSLERLLKSFNERIFENIPSNETLDKIEEDLDGLFVAESSNTSHNINNIFPLGANSNHNINNIFLLGDNTNHSQQRRSVIKNGTKFPNAFKEVSIVLGESNVRRILKQYQVECDDNLLSYITMYGKGKNPIYVDKVKELVDRYIEVVSQLNANTLSYDEDVVTSFINLCRDGKICDVISFRTKKANSRIRRNASTNGCKNIICNIDVGKLREYCFGITPDCMTFSPHDDKELFILDYIKMFWEFYMLIVFHSICEIEEDNETGFFELYQKVVLNAVFTGMDMFLELELDCYYGELYEELKGFKPYNENAMYVDEFPEKQQIQFIVKNSHFLNEAYSKEYNYPKSIKETRDTKEVKAVEIELYVLRGSTDKSVRIEVLFSGQYPISRIYSSTANQDAIINLFNMYHYGLSTDKPILYLFKQILNYSKDEGKVSYYTELCKYLSKKQKDLKKSFVDKTLPIILLILHKRPEEADFKTLLDKYFKPTDKQLRAETRKIYNELTSVLRPKKTRLIDKFRRELERYVW